MHASSRCHRPVNGQRGSGWRDVVRAHRAMRRRLRGRRLGRRPRPAFGPEAADDRLGHPHPARHGVERDGVDLAVIGQHEEVVAVLRDPAQDAREARDAPVDAPEGLESLRVPRAELVRRHVVFHEVHVERGHARVQVRRHAQGEELPQPAADEQLREHPPERADSPPQAEVAERTAEPAQQAADRHHRHLGDQPGQDQDRHDQGAEPQAPPEGMGPEDVSERQDGVVGPAPEHAPVRAAAADDALPGPGVSGLDRRRVPRPRKPAVRAGALVDELEPGDVDRAPVHEPRLERWRGGGQSGRNRMELDHALPDESPQLRHAPPAGRLPNDVVGAAADLDHEEPPPPIRPGWRHAGPPDEPVEQPGDASARMAAAGGWIRSSARS